MPGPPTKSDLIALGWDLDTGYVFYSSPGDSKIQTVETENADQYQELITERSGRWGREKGISAL